MENRDSGEVIQDEVISYQIQVKRYDRWRFVFQVDDHIREDGETLRDSADWWLFNHQRNFSGREYRLLEVRHIVTVVS